MGADGDALRAYAVKLEREVKFLGRRVVALKAELMERAEEHEYWRQKFDQLEMKRASCCVENEDRVEELERALRRVMPLAVMGRVAGIITGGDQDAMEAAIKAGRAALGEE